MNKVYELAYELLNGIKSLRELSADECIEIIETFYNVAADEYRDIVEDAKKTPEIHLCILQHAVKIALNRAGDNDGYYAYLSQRKP